MSRANFTPGQHVLVTPYGRPGIRVPAVLQRHEPYKLRSGTVDGWYVSYPGATEQWHSHCGWVSTDAIASRESVRTASDECALDALDDVLSGRVPVAESRATPTSHSYECRCWDCFDRAQALARREAVHRG